MEIVEIKPFKKVDQEKKNPLMVTEGHSVEG